MTDNPINFTESSQIRFIVTLIYKEPSWYLAAMQ